MKVICIDDSMGRNFPEIPNFKVGDILTAESEANGFYFITEHLFSSINSSLVSWCVKRFIPLSNIDETELLKERYGVESENEFA